MITHIFVLLLAGLLASQVKSTAIKSMRTKLSNPEPRDLLDEAEVKLGQLKDTVNGAISVAQDNLGNLGTDFYTYGENQRQTGELAIQQEYESVIDKLTAAKSLAEDAGVNITACTIVREGLLGDWATLYSSQIKPCIDSRTTQSDQILTDAKYYVDVYINRVNNLEFQLGLCAADSDLCISPVVTQIETGMVQLPQEIEVEVDQVTAFLENLKPLLKQCSDTKIAEYDMDGNGLLGSIVDCINQLLP